ncbi:hypothetical protein CMU39_09365 [Elizabethkingia anophelis]|nr:hypothetical protein [Elizabethkingia anophelis]
MQQNSYKTVKDYFENLVDKSNFLNGFAGFFQRELISKLTANKDTLKIKPPYLALFSYNINLEGGEQNTQALRKIGYAIIFNKVGTDFEQQYQAIEDAEKMAIKILARIKYDNNRKDYFLWNSLIKDSIQISPIELETGDFGAEVFFTLKNPQSLQLDPDDWKDIDSVCP